MQYPLKEYKLGLLYNAPYGRRLSKILGRKHKGVDLWPDGDDDLFPMDEGKVVVAVMGRGACGGQVDIEYQDGAIRSRYCHLRKLEVKAGDKVGLHHVVGLMGSTGISYPRDFKHLHWVTWRLGSLVDPLSLVTAEEPTHNLLNQVNALFRSVWNRQPMPKESHYFQKRVANGVDTEEELLNKMRFWHKQSRFRFIIEMQKYGF